MTPLAAKFATRLRYKVLAAALMLVGVIGAIGLIGFHYVHAVTRSVIVTQRTSPLLSGALAASEAPHRLVVAARDPDRVCATEIDQPEASPVWHAEFDTINRLQAIVGSVGLEFHAQSVANASGALFSTLSSMTRLCSQKQTMLADLRQKARSTVLHIEHFTANVIDLAIVLDSQMTLSEERAKLALQRGAVSQSSAENLLPQTLLDSWAVLRSLDKLREHAVQLKHLVAANIATNLIGEQATVGLRWETLTAMESVTGRLSPRLRALGYDEQGAKIAAALEAIETDLTSTGGFEETQRQFQKLNAEADQIASGLDEAEDKLALEMKGLEDEARSLDDAAQARMKRTIDEAMLVISLVAGVASLGTLLAALRFTNLLTGPIEALTALTRRVQETGGSHHGMPWALLQRQDEIGRLATSFNDMIAALVEARRRLMAESRAEVKIQLERLKAAIEGMPQGIYLVGPDKRLVLSNARFAQFYGMTEAQIVIGTHKDDIAEACQANGVGVESEIVEKAPAQDPGQPVIRRSIRTLTDGRTMVVTVAPTSDGGSVIVHEDITERRRAEAEITHMAHHDGLTGLANRVLFREQTNDSLIRHRPDHTLAMLCLDLDHFKAVNDTLGHPVGDRLLVMAGERLCACLRENDYVARLGGDEFAVILNSNPTPDEAAALANRIIETLGKPYDIDGHQAVIGVSIGVAMAPTDGTDADRLMKSSDMALYRAKKEGRNTHCFFEAEMDARMHERRALELALRNAVASGMLELYYQPLVNMTTNQVEEFEALLRWTDPQRGRIAPNEFIPLAEETGLINEIGAWVLKQACGDAASWPEHVRVAVNISPLQFKTRTLVLHVLSALSASGLQPDRLGLEITEGVLLNDTDATLQTLKELQDIGVRIAMDDFGTGYSSLSYLRKFKFDKVKIDQSFVSELDETSNSRAVIRAVTGLCTSLGIDITAEGVETEEQMATLREEGCTQAQGYLLGRPAPVSSVASYFGDGAKNPVRQA